MSGRVVLVSALGDASGSKAAAAALACAGSEPDRPGLLVDVGGRPLRPTLLASAGARELEERIAVHLPDLRAASRGETCHVALPDTDDIGERLRAALPLVRDSVAVVHAPPAASRALLDAGGSTPTGLLLRTDLAESRALTALALPDLVGRGLRVRVLKRPLGWLAARRALFGVLPPESPGALPPRVAQALLESQISAAHTCYGDGDDEETDPEGAAQQKRRGDAGAGRRGGLRGDPQRKASR